MSARAAAADLLVAIFERRRTLDEALAQTPRFTELEGRDRAFARALATAALRNTGALDSVVSNFLSRPLHPSAELPRALLRIGAAQVLVLDTPPHAAVGETVAAARELHVAPPSIGLINAVLRKVAAQGPALFAAQSPGAALPGWLYTRWRAAYGAEAEAIAAALKQEPPLDISVKSDATEWAKRLGGVVTETGSIRLLTSDTDSDDSAPHPAPIPLPSKGGGVTALDGYSDGEWWVQDAAAALPALLLGDVAGKYVLDLCAAPGGKTLQLAAAGARVTAVDRSAPRLKTLKENLARTKLDAEVICADAVAWRPNELADAILLDAPCSATGTLRRHPDIAWLRTPEDIRKLSALQARLIEAAADMVKPGGRLVYAVCSLEPEEGAAIIDAALASGVWTREPMTSDEMPALFLTSAGDLRTLPHYWAERGGMDGFFAARLVRT